MCIRDSYLTMHKLADYKDKKDAVAVSDKVYNDIEELKKATKMCIRDRS